MSQRINQAVKFRLNLSFHTPQPLATQSLKSLLQAIEPITKGLITRQLWKPLLPIVAGELVNGFFLKQPIIVTEEEDGDQFLVSTSRFSIIAQALKTRRGASIVSVTDTQIST